MAQRNLEKLIAEGAKIATAKKCDIYADELRELWDGMESTFDLTQKAYYAGLAAGYRARKKEERANAARKA